MEGFCSLRSSRDSCTLIASFDEIRKFRKASDAKFPRSSAALSEELLSFRVKQFPRSLRRAGLIKFLRFWLSLTFKLPVRILSSFCFTEGFLKRSNVCPSSRWICSNFSSNSISLDAMISGAKRKKLRNNKEKEFNLRKNTC